MIPDFLKRENRKNASELDLKIKDAIKRYEQHFGGVGLMTEAWVWSPDEWIGIIDECIAQNKNVWELFGEEYDPDANY